MIQLLTITHLPTIAAIESQNPFPWTEGMLRDCFAAGDEVWGIEEQNQLIGYAILRFASDECEILNIAIDHAHRKKGYGRLLLQYLLEQTKQQHAKKVFLEVRESNIAARKLYEKAGFVRVGIRKNYYLATNNRREDAVCYYCGV